MIENDTVYTQNSSLDSLSTKVGYLHYDIHKHLNKQEERFLGATYDTVFTVCVTLIVFVAGIVIDRTLKARQEKKESNDLRKYFFNQIKEIFDSVGPNLTKGYRNYYQNEIGIDQGIPTTPPKVLANHFERLHKIESVKLYSAFQEAEKEKFNEYFAHIDFLAYLLKEIDNFHNVVLSRSETVRHELAPLSIDFHNKMIQLVEFIKAENDDYKNDENYKYLMSKLIQFKQEIDGKRALKLFHGEIVDPVIDYLKQSNLIEYEPGNQLYLVGKNIKAKYHGLKFLVVEVRLQYRIFYNKIDNSISKLKEIYNS